MNYIADLQIHSRFSRAVSKQMTIPFIAQWAMKKGIDLVATGDWNHPMWMREIQNELVEDGSGLLKLKNTKISSYTLGNFGNASLPVFVLATEVSCIFSQGGKGRRMHILLWVPSIDSALRINKEMTLRGCNLLSDGRPIIGLTAAQIAELVLTIEPKALVIPAHAWTPWFSLYGSMSGFRSLDEAFGSYAQYIPAVETGLSSSPDMNWQIQELDSRHVLSFSDSHSGPKLGRESTIFTFPAEKNQITFQMLSDAVCEPMNKGKSPSKSHVNATIEFYPEEGKYHFTGHRLCGVRFDPEEEKIKGSQCPVCGKALTQGVMQRVQDLAGRTTKDLKLEVVPWDSKRPKMDQIFVTRSRVQAWRPPYILMVPLLEIIAESIGSPVTSKKTYRLYDAMLATLHTEFSILLERSIEEIRAVAGESVADGVRRARQRDIVIDPGYDGVFGIVKIWNSGSSKTVPRTTTPQLAIFNE